MWRQVWLLGAIALISACSPVYQLSEEDDLPKLRGSLGDILQSKKQNRQDVLNSALARYGVNPIGKINLDVLAKSCSSKDDPQCVPLLSSSPDRFYPTFVAAIVGTATEECIYETYQLDTTSINQQTVGNFFGIGLLAAGIANGVAHGPTALSTILSTSGAGVAVASDITKAAPSSVQSTPDKVIQAGLNYYPVIQGRAKTLKAGGTAALQAIHHKPDQDPEQQAVKQMLSSLWDAAGSGCGQGVLKGHSWFNEVAD